MQTQAINRVGTPQTNASATHNFEVCSHFLKGNCRFGDLCVRLHPVCAFWNHAGRCLKGDNCNYRHASEEQELERLYAARGTCSSSPTNQIETDFSPIMTPTTIMATAAIQSSSLSSSSPSPRRRISAAQRSFLVYCLLENKQLDGPRKKMHTSFFEKMPLLGDGHRLLHEFLLLEDDALIRLLLQEASPETTELQSLIDESVGAFWKESCTILPSLKETLNAVGFLRSSSPPPSPSSPSFYSFSDPSKIPEFIPGAIFHPTTTTTTTTATTTAALQFYPGFMLSSQMNPQRVVSN